MKYTRPVLKKLEQLFETVGYQVRYEKGQFRSGYCVLKERRVVVVNKFFPLEGRIRCLLDLLPELRIDPQNLPAAQRDWLLHLERSHA
ncbi:MAG: hypothetical protein WBA12_11490 [Catalinimonas sp.]